MALLRRAVAKQEAIEQGITPITENPEYQAISAKIEKLEHLRGEKLSLLASLHAQRRGGEDSSFITFLTVNFLSEEESEANKASLSERLTLTREEMRALDKALELARQAQGNCISQLSHKIREAQFPSYRHKVRRVLRGMLDMQLANDEILNLRETINTAGFSASFLVPFGLAPWPYWGSIKYPASLWRALLLDLRDRGLIDQEEFDVIAQGDLASFRP